MSEDVKAVTGMSELTDTDGAAFVPVQIASAIWERTMAEEENLLNIIDNTPVSGNGYRVIAWNDKSRTAGSLYGGAAPTGVARARRGRTSSPGRGISTSGSTRSRC